MRDRHLLRGILEILPIVGQILGLFSSGQQASQAQARADALNEEQAAWLRETKPARLYALLQALHRAGQPPFYAGVWGRYGAPSIAPYNPEATYRLTSQSPAASGPSLPPRPTAPTRS